MYRLSGMREEWKRTWVRGQYEREKTIMPGQECAWGGRGEIWADACLGSLRGATRSQAEA